MLQDQGVFGGLSIIFGAPSAFLESRSGIKPSSPLVRLSNFQKDCPNACCSAFGYGLLDQEPADPLSPLACLHRQIKNLRLVRHASKNDQTGYFFIAFGHSAKDSASRRTPLPDAPPRRLRNVRQQFSNPFGIVGF